MNIINKQTFIYMKPVSDKKYNKALKIVRAYHQQIESEISEFGKKFENFKSKDKQDLKAGDLVECVEVHLNSKGNLTVGKQYPVKRTYKAFDDELTFYINNDQGKQRTYSAKNSQFKAV